MFHFVLCHEVKASESLLTHSTQEGQGTMMFTNVLYQFVARRLRIVAQLT